MRLLKGLVLSTLIPALLTGAACSTSPDPKAVSAMVSGSGLHDRSLGVEFTFPATWNGRCGQQLARYDQMVRNCEFYAYHLPFGPWGSSLHVNLNLITDEKFDAAKWMHSSIKFDTEAGHETLSEIITEYSAPYRWH